MSAFYSEKAIILRASVRKMRGDAETLDWKKPQFIPTGVCLAIDPLTSNQVVSAASGDKDASGDSSVIAFTVQTAPGVILEINLGDRIQWNGHIYRLRNGLVRVWTHPQSGKPDHQEFVIERYLTGPSHG